MNTMASASVKHDGRSCQVNVSVTTLLAQHDLLSTCFVFTEIVPDYLGRYMMTVVRERYEPGPPTFYTVISIQNIMGRCSNVALFTCLNTAIKSCARLRDNS